ncbi:sigma 54-interacting transcriptional regulator [Salidesulfovibrio onnuriiensis]|uniref:sigma 54-interacting transcriptional regulator n=1 Tax=Salidesulfovibrio onnuriiensis TaxID=2583823 RepID=UPI0016503362|nr:sigma 54-interacting transcriptional regulator [Salidesulfovibrio onnuriiensis]
MAARFLVFDQDTDIRRLLRDILELQGYEVLEVSRPDFALEALAAREVDVCLAEDMAVPGAHGGLLQIAQERGYASPFLLLVDQDSVEKALESLPLGAFGFLRKPVDRAQLISLAYRAVECSRTRRETRVLEHRLEGHKELFRNMIDGCDMPVVILGSGLRIGDINKTAAALLGSSTASLLGKPYFELLSEDVAAPLRAAIDEVRAARESRTVEERRSGAIYETSVKPVLRDGVIAGFALMSRDMTAQKRSEQELIENEQRYRSVYEAARDAILMVRRSDGRILDSNDAALRLYGYTKGEMLGLTFVDLSAEAEKTRAVLSNGVEFVPLRQHRRKSGEEFPIEASLSHFMLGGEAVATVFIRDVSNRRVVQEALREGALLYRAVVEDQTELICRFDIEGRLTFVNPAYTIFFGGDEEAVLGTSCLTRIVPDERETMRQWIIKVTPEHPVMAVEQRNLRYDGAVRWMRWIHRAIFDHKGILKEFQGVGRDVTDRKEAEVALIKANQEKEQLRLNLEATFRSIPDAIITVDSDMHVIATNSAVTPICNIERETATGRQLREVMHCEENPCVSVLEQVLRTRKPVRGYEAQCACRGDTERMVELNCSPLIDEHKRFSGAVLVIKDITRIAHLEKRLQERHGFRGIVGKSEKMQAVYHLLEQLSPLDSTVLITGESGTGKELVADALHYGGPRASRPIVKVNCSALSESLLESELFGHVRGAFTGAVRDKVGRIEAAQGGTLFLDEIGDISPLLQLKLLRFLELKEYERVGDSKTRKADVRIIAATNVDLLRKVREGTFREDLYYRLNVMPVNLPPLRERDGDIPLLVDHFLQMFCSSFKKNISGVGADVLDLFMRHSWPGNVREFKHIMEHACILAPEGRIGINHIRSDLVVELRTKPRVQHVRNAVPAKAGREQILDALASAGGNKAKAAKLLGIHRATLYRKMEQFEIE